MLHEYAVDLIVRHVDEGDNVRCVVRCYIYTPADDAGEPPDHIPKYLITHYWRRMNKTDAVRPRREGENANRRRKVPK